MPHHFEFDSEHKILLTVMDGDVEGSEIQTIDEEMRAAIARTQPTAGISDLSRVANFNVPSHIMRNAAMRQPPPYPEETPRFIVASTDFLFGMMRMYELVADRPGGKLMIVRRIEEAFASLGVTNPQFAMLE